MAFLIGSDRIHKPTEAQQLPSTAVGANGCWLMAGSKNKGPVYVSSIKGGVYDDKVIELNKGRITLMPGEKTKTLYPSNLNEIWVAGEENDIISWVVS